MARKRAFPLTPIKNLHADSLNMTPVHVDGWDGASLPGEDNGVEFWEAEECEECGAVYVNPSDESCREAGGTDRNECTGYISPAEGPMMNYWYPLNDDRIDPEELARKLVHLPLCVVQVNGAYGLALTGGGMDLSEEIVTAFMVAGQCPPLHFLPPARMSGGGWTPLHRWIARGCRESLRVARLRLGHQARDLAAWRRFMDEQTQKKTRTA